MKRFLLPVLYWTLAISPIFAQKQLPVSVQSYLLHQGKSTLHLLDAAGFDFGDQQLKHIESRSPDLLLDSTVTYGNYHGIDSLPLTRSFHSYPEEGVEVIHEFTFDIDHWELYSRTTILSDEQDRRTDVIAQLYDAEQQTYVPESRIRIYPHGQSYSLIDSFFVSVWSVVENTWVEQLVTYNTFDSNDKILESLSSIEFFEIPIVFVDRYEYDNTGLLIRIESFNIDAGEEFPAGRQEMFYQNNLLSSVITSIPDGLNGFISDSRIDYRYTSEGQWEVVEAYDYDFTKNDWRLWKVDGYLYDEESRIESIEVVTLDAAGLWVRSKTSYAYEYDEYVSAESTFTYDKNTESWITDESKYYYYQDETTGTDDPIEADAAFLYPNPTPGLVYIKLPGKVSVHVYTLDGRLMKNFYPAPGEKTLDMSSFPAGVYQVMAKSDEDYFSGKLIIQ